MSQYVLLGGGVEGDRFPKLLFYYLDFVLGEEGRLLYESYRFCYKHIIPPKRTPYYATPKSE